MLSSPDEKATVKEKLTPYVIGTIIFFAATNLVSIFQDLHLSYNNIKILNVKQNKFVLHLGFFFAKKKQKIM